jgi:hypothetical protein
MAHGFALRRTTRPSHARGGQRSTLATALVVLLCAAGCGDDGVTTHSTSAPKPGSHAPSDYGAGRGQRPVTSTSPVKPPNSATPGRSAGGGRSGGSADSAGSAAHADADDPARGDDPGNSASSGPSVSPGRSDAPGGSATRADPADHGKPPDPGSPADPARPADPATPADPGASGGPDKADGPPRAPTEDVAITNEVQLSDMGLGDPDDEPVANSPLAFDGLKVGEVRTFAITVRNTDTERKIAAVSIRETGADNEFRLAGSTCAKAVLKPGETCSVRVTYALSASGSHRAVLEIGVSPCPSPTTDVSAPASCVHRVALVGKNRQ